MELGEAFFAYAIVFHLMPVSVVGAIIGAFYDALPASLVVEPWHCLKKQTGV